MDSDMARKCVRGLGTIYEMLADRKWTVQWNADFESVERVAEKGELTLAATKRTKVAGRIVEKSLLVFFAIHESKVGIKTVRDLKARCADEFLANHLIVVYLDSITPFAGKELKKFDIVVEEFQLSKIQFNVTRHEKVSKHTALTKKEKEAVLKRLNVELRNLPRLLTSDPVARYYNWKKGTCVRVDQTAIEGHEYIEYLVVTQG